MLDPVAGLAVDALPDHRIISVAAQVVVVAMWTAASGLVGRYRDVHDQVAPTAVRTSLNGPVGRQALPSQASQASQLTQVGPV